MAQPDPPSSDGNSRVTDTPPSMPDLAHHPDAVPVMKRPAQLQVRFADADGTCDTLEGPVRFRTGDALITGAQGEQWPIGRERFDQTYECVRDGVYRKRPMVAYALLLKSAMTVPVGGRADPLEAPVGTWLLQYGDGEYGVVDADVFVQTYDVLGAPE